MAKWKHEMVAELKAAVNGEKKKVIALYQGLTGKSENTLYRIAKENGYTSGRKKRCDAGDCVVNDEQINYIAGRMHVARREIKGVIMPVEKALEDAFDNGIIDRGSISVSRMQSILNERQVSKRFLDAPDPHIEMRSLYPNHVHLWDVSVCIQYYLKDGRLHIEDERKFYKNKPENFAKVKQKLYRYVLTDHFSHTMFVKYYIAKGEKTSDLYDFLLSAWEKGKHTKFPFHGVPELILIDAGASNTSKLVGVFLENLGIEMPKAAVHSPRRQGSVEVAQNLVERWFESELRIQPATSIEELNKWVLDWAVKWNANHIHSRHKMTRTQCWLTIKQEQLRELPDRQLLKDLYREPEVERGVSGNYLVSFKGEKYRVKHIPGIAPKISKVKVILRPFEWPSVGIKFDDVEYLVPAVMKTDGGFSADAAVIGGGYKSVPETDTQRAKKIIENRAYGEDKKKDDIPYAGSGTMGIQAAKVRQDFIPRSGNMIDLSEKIEDKEISTSDFIMRLMRKCGSVTPSENKMIREHFGENVRLSVAEGFIQDVFYGEAVLNAIDKIDEDERMVV